MLISIAGDNIQRNPGEYLSFQSSQVLRNGSLVQGMPDIYQSIYQKLEKIGVLEVRQYAVIERPPYVPLCIDRLSEDVYALSQNPEVDGVMVADPDMEIRVDRIRRTAEPLTFQAGEEKRVVYTSPGKVDLKARTELSRFLDTWLSDLIEKGFIRNQ